MNITKKPWQYDGLNSNSRKTRIETIKSLQEVFPSLLSEFKFQKNKD